MKASQVVAIFSTVYACCIIVLVNAAVLRSDDGSHIGEVQGSSKGQSWRRPYFIAHACERSSLRLRCPAGRVVTVARATYGRQRMDVCVEGSIVMDGWETDCNAPRSRSTRIAQEICNGERQCELPVINYLFTDPCPDTYKYLEVYYSCLPTSKRSLDSDLPTDETRRTRRDKVMSAR